MGEKEKWKHKQENKMIKNKIIVPKLPNQILNPPPNCLELTPIGCPEYNMAPIEPPAP